MLMPKVEYTAMLLDATGNVGGHVLHVLVQSAACKNVVVVTRRNVTELANPKVQQMIVNMDKLEEALAPHAKGVVAFGVGKGSATMPDEEVRKIEISYPTALAPAAKAGGVSPSDPALVAAVVGDGHVRRHGGELPASAASRAREPGVEPADVIPCFRDALNGAYDPLSVYVASTLGQHSGCGVEFRDFFEC
jgi:uncharacterized protein YbjT (DUF2867 family)